MRKAFLIIQDILFFSQETPPLIPLGSSLLLVAHYLLCNLYGHLQRWIFVIVKFV